MLSHISHLLSTRLLTNASGAVIAAQAFEYSAFGDLLSTSTPETRYLYTGQQYDSATDLYSLRARYYDAGVGRFMSRDTWAYDFANPVELNRYVYAMGNPVDYVDPSGYSSMRELTPLFLQLFTPANVLTAGIVYLGGLLLFELVAEIADGLASYGTILNIEVWSDLEGSNGSLSKSANLPNWGKLKDEIDWEHIETGLSLNNSQRLECEGGATQHANNR